MNIAHLLNEACTITTVAQSDTRDEYNNPTYTDTGTDTVCWHHAGGRAIIQGGEQTGLTNTQTQAWTAYFPTGTTLAGTDKVTIGTEEFEVVGPPWDVVHPISGVTEFVQAELVRVT